MHQLTDDQANVLRGKGVTDAQLDALRRDGILHVQLDGQQTTIGLHDGKMTMMQGASGSLEELQAIQGIVVKQAETALGMDIDGDGVVGPTDGAAGPVSMTPNADGRTHSVSIGGVTSTRTQVAWGEGPEAQGTRPAHAGSPLDPGATPIGPGTGGPFVSGDGAPKRGMSSTTKLIAAFIAFDAIAGLAFVAWYATR